MADAAHELLPEAVIWHLGLYRDHETCKPVTYYNKLPGRPNVEWALVLDPMLATGGVRPRGPRHPQGAGPAAGAFVALIAAPEGVAASQSAHPDVPVYLGALDSHLDSRIHRPGLGDAGDRQFGTC